MRRIYWFVWFRNAELQDGQTAIVQGGRLRKAIALVYTRAKLGPGWKLELAYRISKKTAGRIAQRVVRYKIRESIRLIKESPEV